MRRVPAPIRRQGGRRFLTGDDWLVDEDAVLEQCMHNPDQKPKVGSDLAAGLCSRAVPVCTH